MRLFNNITADAVSRSVKIVTGSNGANLYVVGDLGGGKLVSEVLVPDGQTWIQTEMDEYISQPGLYVIESSSVIIRFRLIESENPNLTVWLMSEGVENKRFVARGYSDPMDSEQEVEE